MSDTEQRRQRMIDSMEKDFEGPFDPNAVPKPENRIANALEYIAYQLGQINRNLDQFVVQYADREGQG